MTIHEHSEINTRPVATYFSQVTDSGGVFSHWPESVTPLASCAQALVIAVRSASCRSFACALRQSRLPAKYHADLNARHARR